MKQKNIIEQRTVKMIGAICENRIAPMMLLKDFENYQKNGPQLSKKTCITDFEPTKVSFKNSEIPFLKSLKNRTTIKFDADINVIKECDELDANTLPQKYQLKRIYNIKKYNKPNVYETLQYIPIAGFDGYKTITELQIILNKFPKDLKLKLLQCCSPNAIGILLASLSLKEKSYYNAEDIHKLMGWDIKAIQKGLDRLGKYNLLGASYYNNQFFELTPISFDLNTIPNC